MTSILHVTLLLAAVFNTLKLDAIFIRINERVIIGSGNGFSPLWCQAIA